MHADLSPEMMAATVAYTFFGMFMFALSLFIATKVAPFSIQHEIEKDQNTALGIIIGAMFIGIAIIISAAIS